MNNIVVRKNERSWAIEIISQINSIADNYDLIIKRAGGESTISQKGKNSMFPDVILYENKELTSIVQGWELKMPDVPINDETFVKDAQRKARALNLTSTVIWNFTYAKFFVLNEDTDKFEEVHVWENLEIRTRPDVGTYKSIWEKTLKDVVITVNDYLLNHKVRRTPVSDIISTHALNLLINENKELVAGNYKTSSASNAAMLAGISLWWEDIKDEYSFDENDKFQAYSKTVIINWAYRIIFAHLIKRYQKGAIVINDIDFDTTPADANKIFKEITSKCDFYNVFEPVKWGEILPEKTWNELIELSIFLKENGIANIEQDMLQNILEHCVSITRRELNGQFTTPKILARLLARITIHDYTKNCSDPCCGTGTIPQEIICLKKSFPSISTADAINTTWASDKYKMPLQIANISMISADSINIPNKLFQMNAFSLNPGISVEIVNPSNGKLETHILPKFGAICSNLPFIAFENLSDDDQKLIHKVLPNCTLSRKSDLSYYIAMHLYDLLEDDGYLGIIISNSWLGTDAGNIFFNLLLNKFTLRQVHISGKGRWFQNADVVTTILILEKQKSNIPVRFFVWKKDLRSIVTNKEIEDIIVNSALTERVVDSDILNMSEYSLSTIEELHNLNLSYNSLFHNVSWVLDLKRVLCSLQNIFTVIRGSRRGWDDLFFPKNINNIESQFIRPALFNAKNIDSLIASPDRNAFCCSKTEEELQQYPGAFKWISSFIKITNGNKIPLPQVLHTKKLRWYEMLPNEVVPIFTMMNPDERIFFGRFEKPSFINQRLIGFKPKRENVDIELCHALMNTVLMKFFIEAAGFGRGLGVLDISKDTIANCYMLNPACLDSEKKDSIKKAFKTILNKKIDTIESELEDAEWITFNKTVLNAFGIEDYYNQIASSLKSLREIRKTVKVKKNSKKAKSIRIYEIPDSNYDIAAEPDPDN